MNMQAHPLNPDYLDSREGRRRQAAYDEAYCEASEALEAIRDAMRSLREPMAVAAGNSLAPSGYDADPDLVAAWADMDVHAEADEHANRVAGDL